MKKEEKTQYIDELSSAVLIGVERLLDEKLTPYNKLTCKVEEHEDKIDWLERVLLKVNIGSVAISLTVILFFGLIIGIAFLLS